MKFYSLLLIFIFSCLTVSAEESKNYEIIKLRENIYRFRNQFHFSVFIVGKENLLLTDPLGADAGKWLLKEIEKKFGKKKVQYVFYSHNHWDHIAGGEAFAQEGTQFIGHIKNREELERQGAPTKLPNITFEKHLVVDFEGMPIHFLYYGRNNGRGNSAMFIPDQKFLFAVDWALLKRLPWVELYYYDVDGMVDSLDEVLKLDFDLVSPGHSVVGTKNDLVEFRNYVFELREKVLKGMREGKTREQLQEEITMPKYKHFAKYQEWLKPNIKGVFDQMEQASGRYGQEK